ncbi:MAG: nitroreductase [Thermodesulforhabdaceae bacterium]
MEHQGVMTEVFKAIYGRRSVRAYMGEPVKREMVMEALKAASWAPSGLNNQPWRFAIIWDPDLRDKIGALTRYGQIIRNASVAVAVFLDKKASYDYVKDCQAVGACIQNLLLALHSMGLGAVWIGEILKNKEPVRETLGLPDHLELMAVVAIGYPASKNQTSHRKPLEELIVLEK